MTTTSRRVVVVAILWGCGGTPARGPATLGLPSVPALAPAPRPAPIAVAPTSCADAGVLVARASSTNDQGRFDKLVADVTALCGADHWPQAVLDCLGASADPKTRACLDPLPPDARARLDAAGPPPSDDGDSTGDPAIACPDALGDPAAWPGPPAAGSDAPYVIAGRRRALIEACNVGWSDRARLCFAAAHDPKAWTDCRGQLDDSGLGILDAALASEEQRVATVLALRPHAAEITCAKVVAHHYGDWRWAGEMTQVAAKPRAAAIAKSRAAMTKACATGHWDATTRACLLLDESDGNSCGSAFGRWGHPAVGVFVATGIAECDQYYAATVRLADCPGAAQERDDLLRSTTESSVAVASAGSGELAAARQNCKIALDALGDVAKSVGCTAP